MATYYVATASSTPAGNDSNAGTIGAPKLTFNNAKSLLTPGDTLLARAGTYAETITSWPSGTAGNYIRVANYPGETVTIGGLATTWGFSFTTDEEYIDFDGINIDGTNALENTVVIGPISASQPAQPNHIRLQNATILPNPDNTATSTWGAHGIEVVCKTATAVGQCEFTNLTIVSPGRPGGTNFDNGYGIYMSMPNCTIDGCDFNDCIGAGVTVFNDDGALPHNTIITGNRVHGMSSVGSGPAACGIFVWNANNCQIYNNFVYDNSGAGGGGSAGIAIGSNSAGTIICNNTVYNIADNGISLLTGTTTTEVRNNIVYLQGGSAIYTEGSPTYTADHNLIDGTNPGFVNPAAGDFRVTSASAAYHAGVVITSITITVDFYGVTYNSPPTIGAAEVDEAGGTTITIGENSTDTYSGTIDAQIQEEFPTTNYGTGTQLGISKYSSGFWVHSPIRFDLSPLAGKTVTDVTMGLFYEFGSAGNNTVTLYRLLQNWTEAGVTWNTYNGTDNWGTAGASAVTDRSSTSSGSAILQGTTYGYYEITSAQLLLDVQNMVSGAVSNYGWLIERSDAINDSTYKIVTSSEGSDTQRPYLRVTYEDSSTVVIYMIHSRMRRG